MEFHYNNLVDTMHWYHGYQYDCIRDTLFNRLENINVLNEVKYSSILTIIKKDFFD